MSFTGLKVRCQQGWLFWEALRGESIVCLFQLLVTGLWSFPPSLKNITPFVFLITPPLLSLQHLPCPSLKDRSSYLVELGKSQRIFLGDYMFIPQIFWETYQVQALCPILGIQNKIGRAPVSHRGMQSQFHKMLLTQRHKWNTSNVQSICFDNRMNRILFLPYQLLL